MVVKGPGANSNRGEVNYDRSYLWRNAGFTQRKTNAFWGAQIGAHFWKPKKNLDRDERKLVNPTDGWRSGLQTIIKARVVN